MVTTIVLFALVGIFFIVAGMVDSHSDYKKTVANCDNCRRSAFAAYDAMRMRYPQK